MFDFGTEMNTADATAILTAVFEYDERFKSFIEPFDFMPSCNYAFHMSLSEREIAYLRLRYAEKQSLRTIAYKEDLSVERVRQIIETAIKKLRDPDIAPILLYGVRGYAKQRSNDAAKNAAQTTAEKCLKEYMISLAKPEEYAKRADLYRLPLKSLKLSRRSMHALYSAGCTDIGDVLTLGRERLAGLRNIGVTSYNEICDAIENLGLDISYIRSKEDINEQATEKGACASKGNEV